MAEAAAAAQLVATQTHPLSVRALCGLIDTLCLGESTACPFLASLSCTRPKRACLSAFFFTLKRAQYVLTSVKDGVTPAPTSTPGGPSPPAPLHTAASVSVSFDPLTGTSSGVDQFRKVTCLKASFLLSLFHYLCNLLRHVLCVMLRTAFFFFCFNLTGRVQACHSRLIHLAVRPYVLRCATFPLPSPPGRHSCDTDLPSLSNRISCGLFTHSWRLLLLIVTDSHFLLLFFWCQGALCPPPGYSTHSPSRNRTTSSRGHRRRPEYCKSLPQTNP